MQRDGVEGTRFAIGSRRAESAVRLRFNGPWRDSIYCDAMYRKLSGPNACTRFQRRLRSRIRSAFRHTERHQAGEIDYTTPSPINHARQHRLHDLHRDAHIYVVGFEQLVQIDEMASVREGCRTRRRGVSAWFSPQLFVLVNVELTSVPIDQLAA